MTEEIKVLNDKEIQVTGECPITIYKKDELEMELSSMEKSIEGLQVTRQRIIYLLSKFY